MFPVRNRFFGPSARGRILGVSPFVLQSNRIHPKIDPRNFSHDLVKDIPINRFEEEHLSEVLINEAMSACTLTNLQPHQIDTLRARIPNCHRDDREIYRFLLTWFDIYNLAFFGGG
jgi:hypothetical protein